MGEIRGAVERIDVPPKFGSGVLASALFGGDGVPRKIFVEAGNNELLRALVRLRDQIHFVAFVANIQRPREFLDEDLSGFLGNLDGSLQIVFRHRKDFRGSGGGWRATSGVQQLVACGKHGAEGHKGRSARNVRYWRLEGSEKEELASPALARDGSVVVAHARRSVGELE